MGAELIWILVGIGLLIAEALVSGFIAVFFGVAALLVGLLIWAGMPSDGALPWVMFSVFSVGLILLLRNKLAEWFTGGTSGDAAGSGAEDDFNGYEAIVTDGFGPDDGGRGTVSFRGAGWNARAVDPAIHFNAGDIVIIQQRDKLSLVVAPVPRAAQPTV
ncbi:NfeD family protein [bacterium]|nr:NfeD family protein [bacterium]